MEIVNKNEIYLKFDESKIADKNNNNKFQNQVQEIAKYLNNRYFKGISKSIELTIFCTDQTIINKNSMIRFKFN